MSVFVYSPKFCERLTISFCQRLRHFMEVQQMNPDMDPRLHYNPAHTHCALTFVAPSEPLMQILSDVAEQAAERELDVEVAIDSAALLWQHAEPVIELLETIEALALDLMPALAPAPNNMRYNDAAVRKIVHEQPQFLNYMNSAHGYVSMSQLYKEAVAEMRLLEGGAYSFPCAYLREQARFEERLPHKAQARVMTNIPG